MSSRRNAILWIVSTLVLVVGFALGVVGVGQNDQMVKKLVRTPAGCASTVRVDKAGTYYVYVETRGRVASLDGCDNETRAYDIDDAPSVDVRVYDSSDQLLDQNRDDSVAYDTPAGAATRLHRSTSINRTFRHRGAIDDPSAVVAFGRSAAIEANRTVLSAAAVVMLGGLLMLISLIATVRRRRRARGSAAVVVYGSDSPTVTWAPPRPEDRAWSVRDDAEQ